MTGIIGGAAKQVGGLAKHVGSQIAKTPFELLKQMAFPGGAKQADGQGEIEALEQGAQSAAASQPLGDAQSLQGFSTREDYERFADLTEKRDEIELRRLRRELQEEFGVGEGVEKGIALARVERGRKEEERRQVEERQEEQEEMVLEEQEKQEDMQVALAKAQTGAETAVGQKIAG